MPQATKEARRLAEAHGIDLATVEGDRGWIRPEHVQAAIEAQTDEQSKESAATKSKPPAKKPTAAKAPSASVEEPSFTIDTTLRDGASVFRPTVGTKKGDERAFMAHLLKKGPEEARKTLERLAKRRAITLMDPSALKG